MVIIQHAQLVSKYKILIKKKIIKVWLYLNMIVGQLFWLIETMQNKELKLKMRIQMNSVNYFTKLVRSKYIKQYVPTQVK